MSFPGYADHRINACLILLFSVPLLMTGGCTPTTPTDSDTTRPTPQEQGRALAAELEDLLPDAGAAAVDALPPELGPEGSLFGLLLTNGHRLFAIGDVIRDDPLVTGVVIEDADGNLLLRQDNRNGGVRVTMMTGDAFDLDTTEPGLTVTMTLTATVLASTIVMRIDENGEETIDEAASAFGNLLNENYESARLRLPRAAQRVKMLPMLQATNDCPWLNNLSDGWDAACIGWNAFTSRAPEEALKRACNAADLFLESFRGSLPFVGQDEIRLRAISALKIGLALGCEFIDNAWKLGKLVKKLSVPDLLCMGKTLTDELSRLTTAGGQRLSEVLCETIYGTTCTNTCIYADDGECDDGRPGSTTSFCPTGTDCRDCGAVGQPIPDRPLGCLGDGVCNTNCPSGSLDPDCSASAICEATDYCCPGDGVCDAVFCPRGAADDPDCGIPNNDDCDVCCPNDGICDIATCPTTIEDPDCTNVDFCRRLQVCCDDNRCDSGNIPCPEQDYDCGFCGIVDSVCITGCETIDPDCPGSGASFGTVNGYVVHAVTGAPLLGAVVTVVDSGQSDATDFAGAFVIENVPAGSNTLTASLGGYITASVPVTVNASAVTSTTIALVPSDAADNRVTIVLAWSAQPDDLDLHMTGPDGAGGRFHLAYYDRNPTTFVCLDLDATTSFGPETAAISAQPGGTFVAGQYRVWVHNYSRTPEFDVSSATVTIFAAGTQLVQYPVSGASGDASLDIWRVIDFDMAADGTIALTGVQQTFVDGNQYSEY